MTPTCFGLLPPVLAGLGPPRSAQFDPSPSTALALVVSDDPVLRATISDALQARYATHETSDTIHALELAHELEPEIVLCSLDAPAIAGLELCHKLRADEQTRHVPVLLLTEAKEIGAVERAFDAGASELVVVPVHPSELRARVDLHVRLRRLTRQVAQRERMAALGSFAATVAHDLRNPLSALITGLPAVRRRIGPQLDHCTSELMDVMQDCAQRIERMTHDLLDVSRIDREATGAFAPGSGLLACARMFSTRFAAARLSLDTDVDVAAVTSGRAGDINHVFMNVMDNAVRAVDGRGRIRIRGAVEGAHYVVTVGDSGPGIDPALRDRIFDPYWTTRPAREGAGLGLSIAREIVEGHGGSIEAGRSPLGGAEIVIRLPLRRAGHAA